MRTYLSMAISLIHKFKGIRIKHVAPELESLAHEVMNINLGPSWMDEIILYLKDDTLPADRKEAHRLRCKAALY